MILKFIITVLGIIASAILYRMGGSEKFHTLWRDAGCSIVTVLTLGILGGFHWTLIIVLGLMWASLTTYFKKKGEPVRWYNWLLVGLAFSIATIPYVLAMNLWYGFGITVLLLPLLTMLWSVLIGNAVVEELGRGAIIILTIPILFLFRKKKE